MKRFLLLIFLPLVASTAPWRFPVGDVWRLPLPIRQVRIPGPGGTAQSGGGGPTFSHYYAITIGASGSTDLPNWPVCLNTTTGGCNVTTDISASFKTVANGGYVQNTVTQTGGNGGTEPADAVVTMTAPGGSSGEWTCPSANYTPWETESYSPTTGSWQFHALDPLYHHAGGDILYVCVGQATMTTQQNMGSYAPSAVWNNNYLAVLHLPTISSALSSLDSTGNNSFTNNGASAGSGELDGAAVLASGSDLHVTSPSSSLQATSDITLSAWIYPVVCTAECEILTNWNGSSRKFLFEMNGSVIRFAIQSGGVGYFDTATILSVNNWYYVVGTYNSATNALNVFINGSLDANSGTGVGGLVSSTDPVYIGNSGSNFFTGTIDESRISNTARSADWITAEYNNQKASSAFLSVGSLH